MLLCTKINIHILFLCLNNNIVIKLYYIGKNETNIYSCEMFKVVFILYHYFSFLPRVPIRQCF